MAQFKNTTIDDTGFIRLPIGTTGQRPSGTQGMTRYNTGTNVIEFFNGTTWIGIGLLDGSSPTTAATSAEAIKILTGTNTNTSYWITLPTVGATNLFCIMDSAYNGGGWIMAMKATRSTTFNWPSGYWTGVNLLNETSTNQSDADAKFNSFNYFQSRDIMARWPDIGQGGCIGGVGNWTWLQNNFYGGSRVGLTDWFNSVSGGRRFYQDAKTWCGHTMSGVFSSQSDVRFYGFNYSNDQNLARTRWGFGWNENGGGLYPNGNMGSDDVSGGIGMTGTQQGQVQYSAGDYIGCCQDSTGINRSARVEVYVR
jgi:hypothetical protein